MAGPGVGHRADRALSLPPFRRPGNVALRTLPRVTLVQEATMRRFVPLFAVALAATAPPAALHAQSDAAAIDKALAPLAERARADAMVIRWNDDHSYDVLQEGSSRWVCYDRSSETRRAPFDVQCTSVGNLERVAQNRRFRATAADRNEESALLEAAEADGSRVLPEYGSMWIAMRGDDRASAGIHTTIAVPMATTESTGFPTDRSQGGVYLMGAGTSTAHLMVPGR